MTAEEVIERRARLGAARERLRAAILQAVIQRDVPLESSALWVVDAIEKFIEVGRRRGAGGRTAAHLTKARESKGSEH